MSKQVCLDMPNHTQLEILVLYLSFARALCTCKKLKTSIDFLWRNKLIIKKYCNLIKQDPFGDTSCNVEYEIMKIRKNDF